MHNVTSLHLYGSHISAQHSITFNVAVVTMVMHSACLHLLQSEMNPKIITGPPAKKFKRINGYNLFFSNCVRSNPEISTGMYVRTYV